MWRSMYMRAGTLEDYKTMSGSLDLTFSYGCETPEVDAGTPTCVLWEDSMCVYLLPWHLSSPRLPEVVFPPST